MIELIDNNAPAAEPVTLEEVKAFARIDTDEEDSLLTRLITAARQRAEKYTSRTIAVREVIAHFSEWEEDSYFELPGSPINDISKVERILTDGTVQELTENVDYSVLGSREIALQVGRIYSTGLAAYMSDQLKATYTAGYTTVPDDIKLAIMKQVATDYEHRENFALGTISSQLTNNAKSLLNPYRV